MRATTCSLGRVAFGRARGRGEFERVAAAHEDLSVCVPMCSRLPPGELAWGRAPGETRGRGNAMPQPWKLRLHHRFSEDLFGLALTTKAPCGPGRRFETMQAGVASRSWAPDVADRRRGRGTRTSRRQRRVAVRAAQTGTRDDSGDVTRDAWADLGPADHRRGTNRIAETSAATSAVSAVDAPKSGFKVDPITAAAGGTALAAAGVVAALRSNPKATEELVHLKELMEHRAEVLREFGTGAGREMFPVIQRYAKQIQQRYDVLLLPNGIETMIYAEIVKTGAIGAYESLYDNVRNVNLLGHPLKLKTIANLSHQPPVPKVDMEDCEEFVTSVLFDDEDENVGLGIIPRPLEVQIYRNAMVTAVYLMEDTLEHFNVRFFGTQYSFEFGRPDEGWRTSKNHPTLSDSALRRLVREEIQAPAVLRLAPGVEKNAGKVAVALAGEVVGSAEMNFLGLPLRFSLQPGGDEAFSSDIGRIPSLAEAGKLVPGGGEVLPNFNPATAVIKQNVCSETLEIIENYVELYMESRPKQNIITNPFFFSKKLERETYVGFLSAVIGSLENSVICELMGMDVVLNVGSAARDKKGKIKPPNLSAFKVSSDFGDNRREIEELVDWLMKDPMYNIKAVPDNIERAIYCNVFELVTNILAGALSSLEIEILGRAVRLKLSEANKRDRADLAKLSRFRPSNEVLQKFSENFSAVPALQEVMMNVYAFVLAFASYELSNVDVNLVGRKLQFSLGVPSEVDERLAAEKMKEESEFNTRLRQALNTLVEEMVEAAEEISGKEIDVNLEKIEEYERDVLANVGLRASKVKDEVWKFASGVFGSRDDSEGAVAPTTGSASSSAVSNDDLDSVIYKTFLAHHSPANKEFPFPYLSPKDFRFAVSDLVKIMRPGGGPDDKLTVSAAAVQKVANAADINGDGVIQWAEYYFAAKELSYLFEVKTP